ncbi:MAG: nucleotidyl transferase AbiEii/AbiGii toxin family protein [Pseudomonadota bacterium]
MDFERKHHRAIASVLYALDGALLRSCHCLFGGGTAISLCFGEYRESVDIDFLVSDLAGYRQLRSLLVEAQGISGLLHDRSPPLRQVTELRADQYGLRTQLGVADVMIKFEVVFEARISLQKPGPEDVLCNVATLTLLDMVASKLLANADRWADSGVFSRDAIDLAMINPEPAVLQRGMEKAIAAYGDTVPRDLERALDKLLSRSDWLDRCMQAMSINVPKALLWKRLRSLRSRLIA